ncbi:MAG: zinc metalloprotease HtpX [Candidatus Aminicenantes bacterium]|jgi:Zn-dependent protease with chaperone function/Zn-finger nucleic acid-binding protein
MKRPKRPDFYETQRQQWKKSLFLLLILFVFYFCAIGFITFVFLLSFGVFFADTLFPTSKTLMTILLTLVGIAILIAAFHFYDAKKFGAKFIRKRMQAKSPDLSDRYHKQFANTVQEIRLATGIPEVTPCVIPSFAINSMALMEANKTPSILVTEGLLAEFTRDELQAVVAHELAHVLRGDTFYITLVCSLANFFERLRHAAEPHTETVGPPGQHQQAGGGAVLLFIALTISSFVMHLLSTLISRQREVLADAAAVEFSRNPRALARAIYKAHLKNSFVGDFNLTYSPLFIVPPRSKGDYESFFGRAFNSHPPLMRRIKLLADMVPTKASKIIEEVWEIQKNREDARDILLAREERQKGKDSIQPQHAEDKTSAHSQQIDTQESKFWSIKDTKGAWQGPYSLEELLFLPFFTPLIPIKHLQEGVVAQAREFPQIREARRKILKKKPVDPSRENQCPRCRVPLIETFYEGVPLKVCPDCHGKLIDSALVDRIVARKEIAFSANLVEKARTFRDEYMLNPTQTKKINPDVSPRIYCPNCGSQMLLRAYNYYYVIPVDKCLSCHKIWFDPDELEILQILIEHRSSN